MLTIPLLTTSAHAGVKFKIVDEIHMHKIFGLEHWKLIEDDFNTADYLNNEIYYTVIGMHPSSFDSLKDPGIQYLDECILEDLKKFAKRNKKIKRIGFKIVDGFFIRDSDGFEWDKENPKEYIDATRKLNLQRFISRYKKPLQKIFGGIKVYLCGMKWKPLQAHSEDFER
jgi:hypothetical protein